jgi:hypothetical protein
MTKKKNLILSEERKEVLLQILQKRFEKNTHRHTHITWKEVAQKLHAHPEKLWSINEMELSDGEPDVIGYNEQTASYIFCDCSEESPKARRSVCYDQAALDARKEHKPKHSAVGMANEMGIEILTEVQYLQLQELDTFDKKTSSWLQTPPEQRALGGAIFGDYRFNRVFVYHNGAESYYGARGFRGSIEV